MSSASDELKTPDNPPITKMTTDPSAKSIGVVSLTAPLYRVPMKDSIRTPKGTEIISVLIVNTSRSVRLIPVKNM